MGRMMVEIPIPPKWKLLWDTWDLRCFIVLSLLLQTFLIFAAPSRKRTNWIIAPLWSAYLLADQAAIFAIGLISNSMGNTNDVSVKKGDTIPMNLLAFWAPFLLVHLGGPDTITAFQLEDNELWRRHLLGLVFQCVVALYVFAQSLPHNSLWIPTLLMFMTGIMKYSERTRSLYLASVDRFKDLMLTKPDPGPNYIQIMAEFNSIKEGNLPTRIQMVPEPDRAAKSADKAKKGNLTELEVVQYGYKFFDKFKGLVVDMVFSRRERNQSRDFFLNRTAKDAFKVVEVELNFIYDVLYTKLPVVFDLFGAISRFFSLAMVCATIILFILKDKKNISDADVNITYGLLFGALALDMTALIMLLFSDWTIISLRESPDDEPVKSLRTTIITALLRLRTEGRLWETKDTSQLPLKLSSCILKRRWSETISTYNLTSYCLYPLPETWKYVLDTLGLAGIVYLNDEECTDKLKEFIFLELKSKSELADDMETTKEIISARGDWVLRVEEGWSSLLKYVVDVDYDESLILWHIATDLCYKSDLYDYITFKHKIKVDEDEAKITQILSDYMFFLLIMKPNMMSAVAGIGQIRFRDTCAEAKRFFNDCKVGKQSKIRGITLGEWTRGMDLKHINACKDILNVSIEVPPVTVKGDRSKSLLLDGCMLAKELMKIEKEKRLDKWSILSKVWVELLCYAASHTRGKTAQVSIGGELITIVWLLMTHFGLSDQFQINEGQPRAKLIIGK